MPPKRKAQKSEENPVPVVEEVPKEPADDMINRKPRNRKGLKQKDVEEIVTAEPEEVVEKKRRRVPTAKNKDVEVAVEPEEIMEKRTRKVASARSTAEEEDVPKKPGRGRKQAPVLEEESKKPAKSTKAKKKEAEKEKSDVNGTESEKKVERSSRKKKEAPEPLSDAPKPRARKAAAKAEKEEQPPEEAAAKAGKRKAPALKKDKTKQKSSEDKKSEKEAKAPANKTSTDWDSIDFNCTKKNEEETSHNLIISCWNVGGLKSWVKKDCLQFLEYEKPDILCVQETKCSEEKLPQEIKELKLYKQYWCSSEKEGYAGVGILTVIEPMNVDYGIGIPELDEDGRCITAEYKEFYLVCVYVPNAGRKLVTLPKRLEWNEAFKNYVKELDSKKPVIICGDMNVAHNEIDLARPQSNTKNAGFTPEEREGMTDFLGEGYVDTFRKLYPEKVDSYTFWTYLANARAKNVGWRLDYFIVSERIMKKICDNVIRTEIVGSDHCPITLFININAEGKVRKVSQ